MPTSRNRAVVPAPASLLLALLWLPSSGVLAQGPPEALRILDREGRPVVGARVQVWPPFEEGEVLEAMAPPFLRAESGEEGKVELHPPSRPGFLLVVDHPGFEPYGSELQLTLWRTGVRLAPGRTWRGQVEGTHGLLSGGRVCASWVERFEPWRLRYPWERCAEVSSSGGFELAGLGSDPVAARAEVPGYLLAEVTVDGRSPPPGLRLERGRAVRGRVLTAAGLRPVLGATVSARGSSPVEAEANGSFELAIRELPATLEIAAAGYRTRQLLVEPAQNHSEITALLERGESLTFLLTDSESRPLDRAEIGIELADSAQSWSSWTVSASAAPDGRFSVDLPRPGTYRLRIAAHGLSPTRVPGFVVAAAETHDLGNLVLETGAELRGVVVDSVTNQPVAGVEVAWMPMGLRLLRALQDQRWPRTLSDAEGRFAMRGLAGGRAVVTLRAAGRATRRLGVLLAHHETKDLGPVWVDTGVHLRGRVRSEAGEPLSGFLVEVSEAELGLLTPSVTARCGANGEVSVPSLAPGRYRVQIRLDHPVLVEEVEIPQGAAEHWLDLVVPGRSLRGTVLAGGRPVAGGWATLDARLQPGGDSGKTQVTFEGRREARFTTGMTRQVFRSEVSAEGRFLFSALPPGGYTFSYEAVSGTSTRRSVHVSTEPSGELEVTVDGRDLEGRVTDRRTAAGVAALLLVRGCDGSLLAETTADAEGWFTLESLPGDELALQVSASGYQSRVFPLDKLGDAAMLWQISLDQAAPGEVEVRLIDEETGAGASAQVTLLAEGGGVVRSLPADREGARSFAGLAAGGYFVVVSDAASGLVVSDRLEVSGGELLRVEMELGAGAEVSFACEAERCGSAPVELLSVRRENGPELAAFLPGFGPALRLALDGRLHAGFLGPGTYRVRLTAKGEVYSATFRVASTEPSVVWLD